MPANGDWASALWLQQHSESAFFWDILYVYCQIRSSMCWLLVSITIICPGKELGQCLDYNECTVSFGVDIDYFCWQQWQWCSATIQACLWMRHKILASVQNSCFSDSFDTQKSCCCCFWKRKLIYRTRDSWRRPLHTAGRIRPVQISRLNHKKK